MKFKKILAIASLCILVPSFSAKAQNITVETIDKDRVLLAEYCLIIKNHEIEIVDSIMGKIPPESRNDPRMLALARAPRDEYDRLLLYLSPETEQAVSAGSRYSALIRAQSDLLESKSITGDCGIKGSPGYKLCDDQMLADNPALARIRRCNDLSWLPF